MSFEKLGLSPAILNALEKTGYSTPTPIQQKAIPTILSKKDLLGIAQTGTGKTGAFAIPIVQLLSDNRFDKPGKRPIRSLIVTPTRELAIQIQENVAQYAEGSDIRSAVIFGGVKQHDQVRQIKNGIDILIATPGRLLDLIQQGFITLQHIEIFVLDEADRMLDMGFIHDVKKLITLLPKKRQSLFFSATMPDTIVHLAGQILFQPIRIEVAPASTVAEKIEQFVFMTNRDLKKQLVLHLLENKEIKQCLIFTKTKHGADKLCKHLISSHIKAAAIHGDKAQNKRQQALNDFKSGSLRVLVATDIAARGIDIDRLQHVINFEIPNIAETYVHRIGRVGRAGHSGVAYSLCEPEEIVDLKAIEKLIGLKLPENTNHPFPQTDRMMTNAEKKEANKEKDKQKQLRIQQARAKGKMRR